MKKPFKFRYVNEIVGSFVLLVVAALLAGVILAGIAQQWFEPRFELIVTFPPEGSAGIEKGAEVAILGTQVGTVDRIVVDDEGGMEAVLVIQDRFARFVREDSQAILKKKFGIVGDAFVEITRGRGAPLQDNRLPLPAVQDTELIAAAQELLEQVQKAVEEYAALAADLRRDDGHVQKTLAHIEALTAGLERGEGTAGQLLKDPSASAQLNAILETVNKTLLSVQARIGQVETILESVSQAARPLPETLWQTQDTLREAETLLEGVQRHWLLRKYMDEPAPRDRISPLEMAPTQGGAP